MGACRACRRLRSASQRTSSPIRAVVTIDGTTEELYAFSVVHSMVGQTISHYQVLAELGAGGMGVVFRAEDLRLSRQVALKFLRGDPHPDDASTVRFLREARTASSLNHPNICTIYEVDEHQGVPFIAMELLQGQTLDREIGGRPLQMRLLLDTAVQIADALDAAHAQGILHRD